MFQVSRILEIKFGNRFNDVFLLLILNKTLIPRYTDFEDQFWNGFNNVYFPFNYNKTLFPWFKDFGDIFGNGFNGVFFRFNLKKYLFQDWRILEISLGNGSNDVYFPFILKQIINYVIQTFWRSVLGIDLIMPIYLLIVIKTLVPWFKENVSYSLRIIKFNYFWHTKSHYLISN